MLPLGTAAPDFQLPDTNGKTVSLADFKDKPALLVIFMCNHCPYVKNIRAGLAQLAQDYLPRGAAIVGINANDVANHPDDSPAKMAAEVKAAGYLFPYFTMNRRPSPKPIMPPARRTSFFSTGDGDWFIAASSMPAGPATECLSPARMYARRSTPCSPGKPLQPFKRPPWVATSSGRPGTNRSMLEARQKAE